TRPRVPARGQARQAHRSGRMKKATELSHAGQDVGAGRTRPLTPPIYETSTSVFESAAADAGFQADTLDGHLYSRYGHRTLVSVEHALVALGGAEMSLLVASGMAATSHVPTTLLEQGDEVVCSSAVYGGTHHLLTAVLSKFGIATRFVTLD